VPTWNYSAVQAYGRATLYFDKNEETAAFLSQQIDDLSHKSETTIMGYDGKEGRAGPWNTSDAPARYIELLMGAIIGIRVDITRLEGKFKMSQELALGDRQGTIDGFRQLGTELGAAMADTVQARGEKKDAARKA
jgi:transcriptional regulator